MQLFHIAPTNDEWSRANVKKCGLIQQRMVSHMEPSFLKIKVAV